MNHRVDLLRHCLAVYERLSFRDAAEQLAVSPQVVTRAVQELEAQLGEVLFHRSTRSVQPSDFCQRFVPQARQVLAGVDALFATRAAAAQAPVEGTVRVTAPTMQGRHYVAPVLAQLSLAHPGLCFDLRLSDRVVDAVAQRVDVGVRVGRLKDSRFVARTVGQVSLHLCATPELLARCAPIRSLADLDNVPTTRLIDANTGRPWPWAFQRDRELLPARAAFVTDDAQAECEAVLAGLGVGQLAGVLVSGHLRSGALVEVLAETAPRPWPLSVYRVQRKPVPARIRVTYDALVAQLPGLLP